MKPEQWIISNDTGISSKTIWAVMMGAVTGKEHPFTFDVPHDPCDFGRCYRLIFHFPEWRERLHEVGELFPMWKPMIREWDKLSEMFSQNIRNGKTSGWSDEMYKFMQKLEDEGHIEDGWIQTSPSGWEKRIK